MSSGSGSDQSHGRVNFNEAYADNWNEFNRSANRFVVGMGGTYLVQLSLGFNLEDTHNRPHRVSMAVYKTEPNTLKVFYTTYANDVLVYGYLYYIRSQAW
ncbi:hypothetical protein P7H12_25980 [Paenibacillus larvae]|nr:hypothetical protein [Paenibacillus larvae]MDT2266363.1 hypothetical protein [Paenibacillus larvae]